MRKEKTGRKAYGKEEEAELSEKFDWKRRNKASKFEWSDVGSLVLWDELGDQWSAIFQKYQPTNCWFYIFV